MVIAGGTGTGTLHGGAGADRLTAMRHATLTGGGGDVSVFETPGTTASPDTNRVTAFTPAQGDKLAFSNAGFRLGQAKASATPHRLPSSLFSPRTNGTFDKPGERFAYDRNTGRLYFDADGNGAGDHRQLVATLGNHASIGASDLFFVT